jgi:hypothetical protein
MTNFMQRQVTGIDALKHGVNVAVVFGTKKGQPLPQFWYGYTVISGDESDLRFSEERIIQ